MLNDNCGFSASCQVRIYACFSFLVESSDHDPHTQILQVYMVTTSFESILEEEHVRIGLVSSS